MRQIPRLRRKRSLLRTLTATMKLRWARSVATPPRPGPDLDIWSGARTKSRDQVTPYPENVAYALLLGHLCGQRGEALFQIALDTIARSVGAGLAQLDTNGFDIGLSGVSAHRQCHRSQLQLSSATRGNSMNQIESLAKSYAEFARLPWSIQWLVHSAYGSPSMTQHKNDVCDCICLSLRLPQKIRGTDGCWWTLQTFLQNGWQNIVTKMPILKIQQPWNWPCPNLVKR